jgi:hypothetical protein
MAFVVLQGPINTTTIIGDYPCPTTFSWIMVWFVNH